MARTALVMLLLLLAAAAGAWAAEGIAPPAPGPAGAGLPAAAESPPAPAPQSPVAAETVVLDYVPADVDLAVLVRFGQLARSNLWKKFAAPDAGLYQKFRDTFALDINYETDLASAACVLWIVYNDGRPENVKVGLVMEMSRDVDTRTLFRKDRAKAGLPILLDGAATPVHEIDSGMVAAVARPRLVVLAADADCLIKILRSPKNARGRPAGAISLDALAAPGEVTLAGHVSPTLKEAVLVEYGRWRRGALGPTVGGEQLMEFSLTYNFFRVAMEAEGVTGSLDLSREADALRLDVRFRSRPMAPFLMAVLQAMADPLDMVLPACFGGAALPEPSPEPLYLGRTDGRTVHLWMARTTAERFADRLLEAARLGPARTASAEHLRALGAAVRAYVAARGEYPKTWADLTKAELLRDPAVLENPLLKTHLPAGDYELVPLAKNAAARKPWLRVLAYEVYPRQDQPPRLNVLFADGNVQFIAADEFQPLYRQTLESLGR